MRSSTRSLFALISPITPIALLASISCGGGGDGGPTTPPVAAVASVTVSPDVAPLAPQQSVQLSATLRDAGGAVLGNRAVTWTSANTGIASVSGSGLVTGVGAGSTQVTATSEGKGGSATITVTVPVASVAVTPPTASVGPATTVQLTATPKDADGNALTGRSVTWVSGTPAVATVSTSGLVTTLSAGTTQVTATSEGRSGSATVTVVEAVNSVAVTPGAASLVPTQTQPLSVTLRDAGNSVLTGRAVSWSTSAPNVVTVSTSGVLTAAAPGSATITATSEGKSGSASVTVTDGGVVGTTGGSVVAGGGDIRIDVPAGAAAAGTAITIATTTPPPPPSTHWFGGGAAYRVSAPGGTFAAPVTVTLRYDPALLPPWALSGALVVLEWDGAQWRTLSDLAVNATAKTVSGRLTTLTVAASSSPRTFGASQAAVPTPDNALLVGVMLPTVNVSPFTGNVNFIQRSVVFAATLPNNINLAEVQYEWTVVNAVNGTVGAVINNTAQYTATGASIPEGLLDFVRVTIKGKVSGAGAQQVMAVGNAIVKGDLQRSFEISPQFGQADFAQSRTVQAVVRNKDGSIFTGPLLYEWTFTGNYGTVTPTNPDPITTSSLTYTAKDITQVPLSPPRIDKFTVKITEKQKIPIHPEAPEPLFEERWVEIGTAEGFMELGKGTYITRFAVEREPTAGGACVYAYIYVPKIPSATQYEVYAFGFNDPGGYGTEYRRTFSGETSGGGNLDVKLVGTNYRWALDSGCAISETAIAFRENLYNTRFAGIKVTAKVTVPTP